MTSIVVVLLALVALAWVLDALRSGAEMVPVQDRNDLSERKVAALSALADLDEELAAGKITAGDHAALRQRYETDALAVLREIDDSTT